MKTKKAPKFKRRPEEVGGLRLQERDIEIIRLVYDFRFLNSDQIKALIDGSEQGILRRLQKLFHHGFLDRPPSQILYPLAGPQKMVYALGDRGASLLAEKYGIDIAKIKIPDTHLLFWQRENPKELKDYVYIEDHGREIKAPIVPDGFLGIQDPKGKMYFFLEADQSTMTNARFLKKMRAYWNWWKEGKHTKRFGIKAFRVLTITKTKQRKENLRKITKKADDRQAGSFMFWFTSEENYSIQRPQSVLKPIWQTPKDDSYHSILE